MKGLRGQLRLRPHFTNCHMKGVVTCGYLLLTYNNIFLHHACVHRYPAIFLETYQSANSPITHPQVTKATAEYKWIHWVFWPRDNSQNEHVCYSKIYIIEGEAWHICQLPEAKKPNKRAKQTAHAVFLLPIFPKDLWIRFTFTELRFQQ